MTLTLLGKSDATITMIMDALESWRKFPELIIYNNLHLPIEHTFDNPRFTWKMVDEIPESSTIFALGVFNAATKTKMIDQIQNPFDREWVNIWHNSAFISSTAKLGKGLLINNFATIAAHAQIGNFVSISNRSSVNHHTVLEDFVSINPGVNIAGNCHIGKSTLIGIGTTVSNNIKIGANTIIGAGSVVVRDIPDGVIAYGNPCKPMRENGTRNISNH